MVKPTMFLLVFLIVATGCNRQDAESLARIGQKIAGHTRNNVNEMSSKLDLPWKVTRSEPTLQQIIHDRLRWDSTLAEFSLEVHVRKEKEVELKGTVKTQAQKQHAVELAEGVNGVTKVYESILVQEMSRAP